MVSSSTRDAEARAQALERAHYNVLDLDAADVPYDFLSDVCFGAYRFPFADAAPVAESREPALGTLAAALYGPAWYVALAKGRAAEHALFSSLALPSGVVLTQGLFRTTERALSIRGCRVETGPCAPRAGQGTADLDPEWLAKRMAQGDVVAVVLEPCSNAQAGRALHLDAVQAARDLCRARSLPLILDATRILANAHALGGGVLSTAQAMLALADAFTVSCAKEGLTAHGALVAVRSRALHARVHEHAFEEGTLLEPLAAQGALARGLSYMAAHAERIFDERAALLGALAAELGRAGCEVLAPTGGHAVYVVIDDALLPGDPLRLRRLEAALYLRSGVRARILKSAVFAKTLMRLTWPLGHHGAAALAHVATSVRDLFDHAGQSPALAEVVLEALPAITTHYALKTSRT